MTDTLVLVANVACWGTVALVWIAGAAYNMVQPSRTPIRGASDWATTIGATVVAAIVLIVGRQYAQNLVVGADWVRVLGLGVLVSSTAFAVWARSSLGTSWSVGPQIRGDGRLRTTGPYAVTRHPIYTGLLGMLLGSMLLGGGGAWILPFAIGIITAEVKIRSEEGLLLATFPDEYPRYREHVPQLVPGLRALRLR
jgi:protein-S-isoprenylcysteine O-methyltransferase Ste14